MYSLGAMGRLNSHSRKVLICAPKAIAAKRMMIRKICNVPPKFDPAWMEEAMYRLKKHEHIPEQWLAIDRQSPVKVKPKVLHFYGSYKGGAEGVKIRGWDKLNGMIVPE